MTGKEINRSDEIYKIKLEPDGSYIIHNIKTGKKYTNLFEIKSLLNEQDKEIRFLKGDRDYYKTIYNDKDSAFEKVHDHYLEFIGEVRETLKKKMEETEEHIHPDTTMYHARMSLLQEIIEDLGVGIE